MSEIKVFAKDYPMAPIDKFIPYANNARTHSKEQINKLRSIYRGIGYGDPVEVDENFTILSGHGRVEAAKAEGMTELPYVMLSGMTEAQVKRRVLGGGGALAFFGTNDLREIERRASEGDEACAVWLKAFSLNVAKYISAVAATVCGKVDVILLTGGIARDTHIVDDIRRRTAFIAPTEVFAGENELESLAENGYHVLEGAVRIRRYNKDALIPDEA